MHPIASTAPKSAGKEKRGDPNQLEIFVACAAVTGKCRDLDQACVLDTGVLKALGPM